MDCMMKLPRLSPSVCAHYKRSHSGGEKAWERGYTHLCVFVNLNLTNGRVLAKQLYSIAAPLCSCTYYSNVL